MAETLSVLDEIFSESGLLATALPEYEPRQGQRAMADQIWEAFESQKAAIFEAGTGIGKSLAYLIPALLWSYRTGEKIVISTYTIALQEQLIEKDLPFLLDVLGLDLRIVLAKGMGNYVCMKKLDELSDHHGFFEKGIDQIVSWATKSRDGSRSSLPFSVTGETWGKVYAESDACSYVKCPHYKECFFFKGRSKVQEADIIVVNHHLLMAHLLADEGRAILPSFTRLVIDEAHHLEHVARNCLMQTLDRITLFKALSRVHTDLSPETSRLFHIRDVVKDKELKVRLDIDLPGEKRQVIETVNHAFDQLERVFAMSSPSQRWRITDGVLKSQEWRDTLIPAFTELKTTLRRYGLSLSGIEKEIDEETLPKVEHALLDIGQACEKIEATISVIDAFFEEGDVRFAEKTPEGISLTVAKLDVAPFLEEKLFEAVKSPILCSATLTVAGHFQHVREQVGLRRDATEHLFPSPFDFQERTRMMGISDLPPPSSYDFIEEAAEAIRKAVAISGGGAFVLFTSYDMLRRCGEYLDDLSPLKQGDLSRHQLLERFKEQGDGILLGTDSFWEGVDVPGDALRLVIIVKLPFPVPSDPLLQARSEHLKAQGRDPFNEDSVPQAVMKFKQGFGRLMRRKQDRGCVLCLDSRLFSRGYGKTFLKSLPECVTSYQPKSVIFSEMERFYGTWSVAGSNR